MYNTLDRLYFCLFYLLFELLRILSVLAGLSLAYTLLWLLCFLFAGYAVEKGVFGVSWLERSGVCFGSVLIVLSSYLCMPS